MYLSYCLMFLFTMLSYKKPPVVFGDIHDGIAMAYYLEHSTRFNQMN